MKTSTPQTPKPNQAPSFLFIGPPKGGKTTLAMQFPGATFLDCDENLDGPERFVRSKNKELAYFYEQVRLKDDNTVRETHEIADHILQVLKGLKTKPECKVPVIDSLTAVNEFIVRKQLKKQNRLDGCMEARDWQPFKSDFYFMIFTVLRSLNRPTICTVHEQKLTEPDPKNMMMPLVKEYEPTVQGKIADFFGAFFTDVWRCTAEPRPGGKMVYYIDTNKTSKTPLLGNSFGLPPRIEVNEGENAFEKVNAYMKLSL
jgi:hypothetical protein